MGDSRRPGAASDRDLENEVDTSIHLAKRVLSHLLSTEAGMFPLVKEPGYEPTEKDVPK